MNYCALNVALYGPRKRWAMTERGCASVARDVSSFAVGPSALHWNGDTLTIDIDEITVPFPSRIKGRVRIHPRAITQTRYTIDSDGAHNWWPIAPMARVEVEMQSPALRWQGNGYLDSNFGNVPLEASFVHWDWSRATLNEGAAVLYDTARRDGTSGSLALRFDESGRVEAIAAPPRAALPPNGWRVARRTRADDGRARVIETLENAPFYARSLISTRLLGEDTTAVHESLSLDRFSNRIVQLMLPFRMPRALR